MALKGTFRNQGKHLFELRIILLGGRNSGKSLVGNAILNQEEFILHERTTCLRRKAEVQGRSVTVVDTPGWWCDFSAQDTPKLVRTEIKHSVSLSLPGPHVFLLVVKTDSVFIEKRRRAVEQHIRLLGETVWSHTLVLFTKGKNKGNKSFEDHIQASGEPLQWLLKKCTHRFHVLDTQETCFSTQVRDLMGKIDKLVAENERRHFEIDIKTLQEIEDRRREVEIKAQQRLMRIHKQRSTLKALSSHHQNIRLVLLGAKGSGKSSTGNSILATERGKSFTAKKRTTQCMKKTSTVMGRQVTAVDTPGWWMNYFTQDSSTFDKEEIVKSVYLCPPGPHAFLLVVRVDRSLTEIYRRAIEEHIELLSKDVWNHSIVLFTFGDWLGETTIEQYIESEGKTLQWLVERCGNRYHVLNNKSFGNTFQITELLEKIEEMTAGNSVSHFETNESLFKAIERKRQVQEDRAKLRRENVLRRRESLSALKNQVQLPTAVTVILLGAKHSGKTSSASCILRKGVQEADNQKTSRGTLIFNETKVEVLDTPGWMAECPDIAEFTGQLLNNMDSCSAGGIRILLLVVNASSSFTPKNLKAFEDLLCGKAWSSTLVLFTNGDWLGDVSVEQYIESEGDALQKLVEKCRNRYQVFNNKIKDDDTQVTELVQKIEEMMIEQMLNSPANRGNIEHPLVNAELQIGGNEQIGKVEISPLGRSTNIPHGDTDIGREHQMIEITKHAPSTSKSLRNTLRDSFSQTENQALVCRRVRLSDTTSLPRSFHRRLVVVLDTSEWFHPHEPWITVNRTDGSETDSATEQHRNKSKAERFYAPSLPYNHRETSYSAQTAKERAFMEFVQSESLQNLIDQWGDSNIKELEAFIDSYFEMVWQEALKEPKRSTMTPISCESSGVAENDQAHLASIDRKLSKLDILEGVQKDLWELKQSVKHCSRIFQELKDRNKETHDPSRPSEATASAEREGRGRSDEECKELSRT